LRKNFRTDLHEIFREGWQWANKRVIKFRWPMAIRIKDPDADREPYPDPYRDTDKTYLGGGMHCLSASSCYCHCCSFCY